MNKIISKYKNMDFKSRTIFFTKFSCIFNLILAIGKIVLSIFQGIFFLVAGIVNIFIMLAKLECFYGIKKPLDKPFSDRNNVIGLFLLLAGLEYVIYMTRLIFVDTNEMQYDMILGIIIALVSFIELGVAINGCFKAYGKGHFYRNIKLINLCSAFTAIVLTEIALTASSGTGNFNFINGIVGMIVGVIIIFIAIFIFFAPSLSIVDKEHRIYKLKENCVSMFNDESIEIQLTNSKYHRNYYFLGYKNNDVIDGHIIQKKSPILSWNIWVLIIVFTLSEILIFPFGVSAFIFYIKSHKIIKEIDLFMEDNNYSLIEGE